MLLVVLLALVSAASARIDSHATSENGNQASVEAMGDVTGTGSATADADGASATADYSGTDGAVTTSASTSDGSSAEASASVADGFLMTDQTAAAGTAGPAEGAVATQDTLAMGEGIEVTTEASTADCGTSANAEAEVTVDDGIVCADQMAAAGSVEVPGLEIDGAAATQKTFAAGEGIEVETEASVTDRDRCSVTTATAEAETEVEQGVVFADQGAIAGTLTTQCGEVTAAVAAQDTFAAGKGVEVETEASFNGNENGKKVNTNAEAEAEVGYGFVSTKQEAGAGQITTGPVDPTGSYAKQDTLAAGFGVEVKTESETEMGRKHKTEYEAGSVAGVMGGKVDTVQNANSDTTGATSTQATDVDGYNGFAVTWSEMKGCGVSMEAATGAVYRGEGSLTTTKMVAEAGSYSEVTAEQPENINSVPITVEVSIKGGVDAGQENTVIEAPFAKAFTHAESGQNTGADVEAVLIHGESLTTTQFAGVGTTTYQSGNPAVTYTTVGEVAGQKTTLDGGKGWASSTAYSPTEFARASFFERHAEGTVQQLTKTTIDADISGNRPKAIQDATVDAEHGFARATVTANSLAHPTGYTGSTSFHHDSGYTQQYASSTTSSVEQG